MATTRDLNVFPDATPAAGDEFVISDISDTNDPDKRVAANKLAWLAANNAFGNAVAAPSFRSVYSGSISDDGFVQLTGLPDRGVLIIASGTTANETAIITYRQPATTYAVLMYNGGQWGVSTAGVPTGTTGTDTYLTLFVTLTGLYVENRRGGMRAVMITALSV